MDTRESPAWVHPEDREFFRDAPGLESASVTESVTVRAGLVAEIRTHGPITFARFMERCLYGPDGYYSTRNPVGPRGDYLTSPELHPVFGAMLARLVDEAWRQLGRPTALRLVEQGAGNGALLRGVLAAAGGTPLGGALRPFIVEPLPVNRLVQQARLEGFAAGVTWVERLAELEVQADLPAVFFSNELVDSFPVRRVSVRDGRLVELLVGLDGEAFVDVPGDLSTPEIPRYFERLGLLPAEGAAAEVNLAALAWMGEVAAVVRRGLVLTLDYGYEAPQLYAPWRREGTLLCFYGHSSSTDPYRRVGRQDITAHIDFTSLMLTGAEHGLRALGLRSQRDLLVALGIGEALQGGPGGAGGLEEYLSRRRAIEALLDSQGLGRIRVLAQAAGPEGGTLEAFAGSDEANRG